MQEGVGKLESKEKAIEIAKVATSKLADNVRILHVGPLSSVAEYIVLASCGNERQVKAVNKYIEEAMIKLGEKTIGQEGKSSASSTSFAWLLMDYSDVVVHIFHKEARLFYDLDGLWADVEEVEFEAPDISEEARESLAT